MNRILVTGGSGFLGRHLLKHLLTLDAEILVPTRFPQTLYQVFGKRNPQLIILKGTFYAPDMLAQYRKFKPDAIIHLAAIRGEGNGKWRDYYEVNVKGTEVLVQFALDHRVQKFIYCSTVGVFGTIPERLPADPWAPANPDNWYHKSKYLAESYVVNELRHRLPFAIVRPTITYGPGDNGFVAKLTALVKKRMFPLIHANVLIHLLDVRSFSQALSVILNAPEKEIMVNLADKEPIPLQRLVDEIHRYFYGKKYPRWRQVPGALFSAGKAMTRALKLSALNTSLRLLSESWYYDTSHMEQLHIPQMDTLVGVRHYLKRTYPR